MDRNQHFLAVAAQAIGAAADDLRRDNALAAARVSDRADAALMTSLAWFAYSHERRARRDHGERAFVGLSHAERYAATCQPYAGDAMRDDERAFEAANAGSNRSWSGD